MSNVFAGMQVREDVMYEEVLHHWDMDNSLHASHSILAGHGLGLCQAWSTENDFDCVVNQGLPAETYLLVAYYSHGVKVVLTEETTSVYDLTAYT